MVINDLKFITMNEFHVSGCETCLLLHWWPHFVRSREK